MSPPLRRVAVYCGSSGSAAAPYYQVARSLGAFLADQQVGVVYGGGRTGMMGALADGALARGGEVIGVIPKKLMDLELAHPGLDSLHIVEGMHPRKKLMMELADAFIAMPGGYGTLDELFETTTWTQLNLHLKPVALLNIDGFFDPLLSFIRQASAAGFIRSCHRDLICLGSSPEEVYRQLCEAKITTLEEWMPATQASGTGPLKA